jgi:hypothetical protein
MARVDMRRVVLGGVVAAVIVNVFEAAFAFLMRSDWEAAVRRLGIRLTPGPLTWLPIAWSFAVGIVSVWLYAAIRPRYGPGARTAIRAALAVWALSSVSFGIALGSLGFLPGRLALSMTLWSLVEVVVAMLVGAALYREKEADGISSSARNRR